MGENPLVSDPNSNSCGGNADNVDFLVVQDIFMTETARFAHVILPGDLCGKRGDIYQYRAPRAAGEKRHRAGWRGPA